MKRIGLTANFNDLDGLRLLGLGRIPRCTDCPRYAALVSGYADRRVGGATARALPAVPANCHFAACIPLVRRYAATVPSRPGTRAMSASALAS